MKSGISISKINEMINEGLASAGGGEWTLLKTINCSSNWHTIGVLDIESLNVNELMFTSDDGTYFGKTILTFTEFSTLLKSDRRFIIHYINGHESTLHFITNGRLEIYHDTSATLKIYYR